MLKYILLSLLFLSSQITYSQNSFKAAILDEETAEPIVGATVYFPNLDKGKITDVNGTVNFTDIPDGKHQLQISYVGYETIKKTYSFPISDDLLPIKISMHHDHEEMEEVTVTSTRSSRTIEDIPTRVEMIAGEELAEKGNMKPGDIRMLLNESTGIQTQQTSATSYNSSIRIQGLDGKYTQLMRDGMPLYSGFSGGLSLMQIAPLDLKQVEVIKGSSSTLYGGGAIAGLVNLITKKPKEDRELSFMFNGTSALGLDASTFYSKRNDKIGTTIFASYNKGTAYDPADIGLTAIPKFDRFTLNPRLFLYFNEETEMNVGVNIVTEDRLGGNMDYVNGENVTDAYYENNETDRISSQLNFTHQTDGNSQIEVKNSINFYDRSIEVPDFTFSGRQISSFSEINYSTFNEVSEWVAGANLWTDQFNQFEGSPNQELDFENNTVGLFAQNIWNMADLWTLETGFRIDYHSEYGLFPLPKLSLMFEPQQELTLRLGGGLGYKTPTVFSEDAEKRQFRNIQPINTNLTDAERSLGANFDINYKKSVTDELTLSSNVLFFYTQIENPLMLRNIGTTYEFQQFDGYIDTKGAEVNMKWSYHDFKLFLGYTYSDVNTYSNGDQSTFPLVAKNRLNNVLMYEKHGNFWIGLEAYYFSPQQLNDGEIGQAYWITGLMTEKTIGEYFSVFLNFENFLDTRQTAFDTIYTGSIDDPEFRDIYAPVDGFVINGGLKIKL
ncbi:TonB-dependent receptor [Marivirga harenae]|uniref:TonB-dependent receptor n=1 Tax=Marivirga harenae TaxID=2010992 RepID=UPI0026DEEC11|nr:TonB-dependent receptor [Marivirga harenae]WKV12507.1 TonB-dependent receptor [Marivirga harenae]|tara:strand:+ start:9639 stop:11810 length:2172 start_codon:yes stop_codon:yes gene_type:complete